MSRCLSYGRQWIFEEDIEAVSNVLRSDMLTQGPEVRAFEEDLCSLTGARACVCVSNGTSALYVAARAMDIGIHDTIVTTPLTFCASANAFAICGARVDFVDIDADTLCLDPEALYGYIKQNGPPAAVVVVDFAGVAADLSSIYTLAREYGFYVVEDAAHSIGTTYSCEDKQIPCGACIHSDIAIFSFHPVKNITSAEGGAILSNNEELSEKFSVFANHGIIRDEADFKTDPLPGHGWYYELQELSLNFRMSDLHAALGRSQLKKLPLFKKRRQKLFSAYMEELAPLEALGMIKLPKWPKEQDPCFHLFVIRVMGDRSRQLLYDRLREEGICPQVHYWPVHLQPYYINHCKQGAVTDCKISEEVANSCISLPFFASMDTSDVHFVCTKLKKILAAL